METKQVNSTATLLGGVEIEAVRLGGTKEPVKIRQLHVSQLQSLLNAIDDEAKLVEVLCDKPAGWAAGLTEESFVAILAQGEPLNKASFDAWLVRRQGRMARLTGAVTAAATE